MSRVRDAGKLQRAGGGQDLVSTHAVSSGDVSSCLGDESLSTSTILHFYMSTQHAALQQLLNNVHCTCGIYFVFWCHLLVLDDSDSLSPSTSSIRGLWYLMEPCGTISTYVFSII